MPKRKPPIDTRLAFKPCRNDGCNSSGWITGYADMGKSFPLPTLTKCACLVRFQAATSNSVAIKVPAGDRRGRASG